MSKLVCNEELSIIELEYKINLHSCDIAKAILFQLFTSIQVEGNMHAPFQHQPKPFAHVSGLLWSRNSTCKNIILFSHEKVVVLQFDANYWFYAPIHAKWLPLKLIFEIFMVSLFVVEVLLSCSKNESMRLNWLNEFPGFLKCNSVGTCFGLDTSSLCFLFSLSLKAVSFKS